MEIIKDINTNIFRAYDIRGEYPTFINEDIAYTIGLGYGSYIKEHGEKECVIGYDNRLSSKTLFEALTKGILETGINITNIGLVTTPIVYFARICLKVPASIMITASHNPKNENGFKISFDSSGSARETQIKEFAKYVNVANFKKGTGVMITKNIKDSYIAALIKDVQLPKRLKVVLDCGNGTTSVIIKEVFANLNIDVDYLFATSDGNFPNHHPDPCVEENMQALSNRVQELKADIGIGFDGDGDRIGIVDNEGHFVSADFFSTLFVKDILKNNPDRVIVGDIKCTRALKDVALASGGEYVECRTGAPFMAGAIKENNAIFGAEYSGHIYFNDRFWPITSSMYSALRLIEILSKENKNVKDLLKEIPSYYKTWEIRIPTTDDLKFKIVGEIEKYAQGKGLTISKIDGIKILYLNSWALVRASNTGPNLTLMFESTDEKELLEIKNEYLNLVNLYNK
ncbi:MAG TPA: phosphomannomutase/phosphoglucomutase [Bacilli bacterium]|nr:phosphomannomutase/phosphoglucomutase [Bacilli bacterium]